MAAKRSSSSSLVLSPFSVLFPRGDGFLFVTAVLTIFSLLLHHLSASPTAAHSQFEGFDADEDDDFAIREGDVVTPLRSPPPPISLSTVTTPEESHYGPPDQSQVKSPPSDDKFPNPNLNPSLPSFTSSFDYWDEDEFEGIPQNLNSPPIEQNQSHDAESDATSVPESDSPNENLQEDQKPVPKKLNSYSVEIACVAFLIVFTINYFTGKRENENLALSWASNFATKGSVFDKNFSLLGVGETDDAPLLLKEGQNVFKFYASGRRFCSGLVATMELKSRHELISRLYNMVVPCKDEITFHVYMNDDSMDQVVFALAKKKLAKSMQKEERDLLRFAGLVAPPNGRKWVAEELQVVSESKEVAGDLITDAVLDQVFGDKAFEKFGKGFISMHFSDQQLGSSKKMLIFKFAIPVVKHIADMTRLVALVPYYIDVIGRYKLSSQARSKTDATRSKIAHAVYKELQNARQEALHKKKAEQRKKLEEAEAKLNAEALRKKEAKESARQMKKAMPKLKTTKAH